MISPARSTRFKEREGHEGRLVRGRQILHKLNAYLSTNALHGSVYDMEDLLNFVMINENLVQFIRNWDTVLSGMKKLLADDVLQPLFHRQVKKAKILSHDIAIYERAVDGSTEKTYEFLYNAVNRLIKIKRLERNRERIAKQAAAGMPSAPAPLKRVPKGFCIDFVRNGSCSKDQCTYKHRCLSHVVGRRAKAKVKASRRLRKGEPFSWTHQCRVQVLQARQMQQGRQVPFHPQGSALCSGHWERQRVQR